VIRCWLKLLPDSGPECLRDDFHRLYGALLPRGPGDDDREVHPCLSVSFEALPAPVCRADEGYGVEKLVAEYVGRVGPALDRIDDVAEPIVPYHALVERQPEVVRK